MMTGTWLSALARRLLHHDTFELVVSPAIADLQFEQRGHAAVCIALAGALCHDIVGDLRALCEDAAMLARLVGIQASYFAGMLGMMGGVPRKDAPIILVSLVVLCAAGTLILFWPQKRRA
jgi:hypothetical protein